MNGNALMKIKFFKYGKNSRLVTICLAI